MTKEKELINHIKDYLDNKMWKYEACQLRKEDLELIIKLLEFDKLYTDIQRLRNCSCSCSDGIIDDVEDIIDEYKEELGL